MLKDFVDVDQLDWTSVVHRGEIHALALASALVMAAIWRITHPAGDGQKEGPHMKNLISMAIVIALTAAMAFAAISSAVHVPKGLKAPKTVRVVKYRHVDEALRTVDNGYVLYGSDGLFYYLMFASTQPTVTQNYYIPGNGNVRLPAGASVSASTRPPNAEDTDGTLTVETQYGGLDEVGVGENTAAAAESVGAESGDPVAVPSFDAPSEAASGGSSCGGSVD